MGNLKAADTQRCSTHASYDEAPSTKGGLYYESQITKGSQGPQQPIDVSGYQNDNRCIPGGGESAPLWTSHKSEISGQSQLYSSPNPVHSTNRSERHHGDDDTDPRYNGQIWGNLPHSKGNQEFGYDTDSDGLPRRLGCERRRDIHALVEFESHLLNGGYQQEGQVNNERKFIEIYRSLFSDYAPQLLSFFDQYLQDYGLVGLISRFQGIAQCVIDGDAPDVRDAAFYYGLHSVFNSIVDILQVLRFGKRYTPAEVTKEQEDDAVQQFLARNNRAKLLDRNDLPSWLFDGLRMVSMSILSSYFKGREWTFCGERSFETDVRHIPHGTTAEGLKSPAEKFFAISAVYGEYNPYYLKGISLEGPTPDPDAPSVLKLVPKDYRGPRLIAMEPIMRTCDQSIIADNWMKVLETKTFSKFCPAERVMLDDQRRNQRLAYLGSLYKELSTWDLSNASDSITYKVQEAVLPKKLAAEVLNSTSKRIQLPNGKVITLYIPFTMGSRLTVPGQSYLNWCIVSLAVDFGVSFGLCDYTALDYCAAYNDDIIAPTVLDDIVQFLLEKVGYVVNHGKSYTGSHPFRESCGRDFYNGHEVTSLYWPRRELGYAVEDLPSLCALQNKLWILGAAQTANLVEQYAGGIYANIPRILPSDVGQRTGFIDRNPSTQYSAYTVKRIEQICYNRAWLKHEKGRWVVLFCRNCPDGYTRYDRDKFIDEYNRSTYPEDVVMNGKVLRYKWNLDVRAEYIDVICDHIERLALEHYDDITVLYTFSNVYKVREYTMVPTFDNRVINSPIFDKSIIHGDILDDMLDHWEYTMWLIFGSEYYDELCEYLHITQPGNRRKMMRQVGYKTRPITSTLLNGTKPEAKREEQ